MNPTHKNGFEKSLWSLYRNLPAMPLFDRLFAWARMKVLPLEKIDKIVPKKGTIVEIGCGHGLIANYLALSSPERRMIGVDIDDRRISMARGTVRGRSNIRFDNNMFLSNFYHDLDNVILFGVLLLIPYSEWKGLFGHIHAALKPSGEVLLHDVFDDGSLTFRLHRAKEGLLKKTGITKGEGFFVKKTAELKAFVKDAGFTVTSLGKELDVPFHSCFSWILKKN